MNELQVDDVVHEQTTLDPSVPFQKMRGRDDLLRDIFDQLCLICCPSLICDIGAFNGDESYRFAHLMPESTVFAFEASPQNYQQFYVDSARFASVPNFHVSHRAITDYDGEIAFNVLDADEANDWQRGANSILQRTDGVTSKSVTVPCSTLDASFGGNVIDRNTFALWIDVEGALDKVLAGAQKVLSKTLFLRAEVEWKECWVGQKLASELKEMIGAYGFSLVGDSHVPQAYDQSDVLFINNNIKHLLS
ncbi:FkbM family methyltransferase [Croceibacterium mercuriale]|uniref:FkbM family methyltransferase n=1 Tax=Croceibacterium mercuriale TaxID=1572751 RepID=UPI00068EE4DD|nr:FkbM family methyltransferase [Croceibacterium mercuriale]